MQNLNLLGLIGEALMGKMPKVKYATAKPKQGKPNPMRGYYSNYTSGLTAYFTEKNLQKILNKKAKAIA